LEDAIWNIRYQPAYELQTLLSPQNTLNPYDYDSTWTYTLPNQVNNDSVSVKIKNAWIPYGITAPTSSDASSIINNTNLIVTGQPFYPLASSGTYEIDIISSSGTGTNSLPIASIGVWLPQGFIYTPKSSSFQKYLSSNQFNEQVVPDAGNEAVIWSFPASTTLSGLQSSLSQSGNNALTIDFSYSSSTASSSTTTTVPEAIPWINLSQTNSAFNYYYTWDADVNVYDITSSARNTTIESHVAQAQARALGTAINGDYLAIGNSLMGMGSGKTKSNDPDNIRYSWIPYGSSVPYSSAIANSIPSDAKVTGAYLYWTGWFPNETSQPMGPSYGEEVDFEINGNQVYFDSKGNPAQGAGAISCTSPQTDRDQTVTGYSYSCYKDVTALLESYAPNGGDAANPITYTIAALPNCALAVTASYPGLNETQQQGCYAGWSLVIIYTSPETLGHQLFLYDTFQNGAQNMDIDITDKTGDQGGGTISGFIVPPQDPNTQDTNPQGTNSQGVNNYDPAATITAFVGEGDWCYAGDSLEFNAVPLWDGITIDTSVLAAYPYLPNTAAEPDNVWNSYPQTATSQEYDPTTKNYVTYTLPQYQPNTQDGVDIKTFVILWESGLLQPGATSAHIDLPTQTDQWNFVYMILSFRSSVTSGGTISYLIK
jgi:hypothetical protein